MDSDTLARQHWIFFLFSIKALCYTWWGVILFLLWPWEWRDNREIFPHFPWTDTVVMLFLSAEMWTIQMKMDLFFKRFIVVKLLLSIKKTRGLSRPPNKPCSKVLFKVAERLGGLINQMGIRLSLGEHSKESFLRVLIQGHSSTSQQPLPHSQKKGMSPKWKTCLA